MAANSILDGTGTSPANKVTNEEHAVNVAVNRMVMPDFGPFFDTNFGLVVEGKVAGSWVDLKHNVDFLYSQYFVKAAAMVGKQAFTYIVLIRDVTDVRFTYQALGPYTDVVLISEVAKKMLDPTFDASEVYEWDKIWGAESYYDARVRNPDLHDKSEMEVLSAGMEKLLEAISNPKSSSVVTTQDITKLQLAVAGAASKEDIEDLYDKPTVPKQAVVANTDTSVVSIENKYKILKITIGYQADDGRTHMFDLNLARKEGVVKFDQNISGEVFSDENLFDAITSEVISGQIVIKVNPNTAGTVHAKIIFAV